MNRIPIYAYHLETAPLTLAQYQERLSPERLAQLARFPEPHRQHNLAGDLLAQRAYHLAYPTEQLPPKRAVTKHGKPFFPAHPMFHYSISHSGTWAVCAVWNMPIGVDIQEARQVRPAVFRALSDSEQRTLSELGESQRLSAFFDLWCLKEAYVKATGLGLTHSFRTFSVSRAPTISVPGYALALVPFPDPHYHLGLCVQGDSTPSIDLEILERSAL